MYSAYKLNKQGDNIWPWHTPFPIWNQSVVPCPVLTVASLPAHWFLRRQVKVVWYSHLFPWRILHSLLWSTQSKALAVTNVEIDVFLELFCFLNDTMDVDSLLSGSSAFYKSNLNIWKFTVHILVRRGLENFEHYLAGMWDECNCVLVWAFFGIAFLCDWKEKWPFPVLWPLLSFPNLLAHWVQHFHNLIF